MPGFRRENLLMGDTGQPGAETAPGIRRKSESASETKIDIGLRGPDMIQ